MSAAYWDPQRLLDISISGKRVTCVGQKTNKYTGPCSFKPPDAESSGFRQVLQQLSRTPPELVTFSQLSELAQLSLCKAYHSGQRNMIARRWQQTVKTALSHKKSMSGTMMPLQIVLRSGGGVDEKPTVGNTGSSESLMRMKRDLEFKQRLLEEYSADVDNLTARLRLATETQYATTSQLQSTNKDYQDALEARKHCEDEIVALRNQLSSSQEQAKARDLTVRQELDCRLVQVKGLQDDLDQARCDNQRLQARLSDLQGVHSSLRKSVEKLRSEAVVAAEREKQTETTLEARELALHDSQFALNEQKSRLSVLEERVSYLSRLNSRQEGSIRNCWLHRLKAWIAAHGSKHGSGESH